MVLSAFLALSFAISSPVTREDQAAETRCRFLREIIRGFNAATFATRDTSKITDWNDNLRRALAVGNKNQTNSAPFLLGAEFGFSFRVGELDRNGVNVGERESRALAIQGTLARIRFERIKHALGITDAHLVSILRLSQTAFIAWKTSVTTSDLDDTVVGKTRWLYL